MGVDYYTCANCHSNFPDCGSYFHCTGCDEHFCSYNCGGRKVVEEEESEDEYEYEELTSCVLCRREKATDSDLLDFLLNHFNITYEAAMEIYKKKDD
jgi:hypothetical protein